MVTFITVLQVNLVMSALLYLMFLAYLLGFQARPSDRRPPAQDPVGALIIQLLQEGLSRERQRGGGAEPPGREAGPSEREAPGPPEQEAWEDYPEAAAAAAAPLLLLRRGVPDAGADLLRQSKRYSSPRVLLSDRPPLEPPPLYLRDEHAGGGGGGGANGTRRRRHAQHRSYRGEYSVCDSESQWVTDKTAAVDIRGRPVTVLGSIKASGLEVKQYFYETNCRSARPARSGCRGIDDKHWSSQCKTAQTYVRALTAERNSVGWRWIRIDTSCVCALSRKKRRT